MSYIGKRPSVNTLKYSPRSSDPTNPTEGEVQYADGTARSEGLWVYTNGDWTKAGSNGSGEKNYILNSDAESGTTGWVTYNNSLSGAYEGNAGNDSIDIIAGTDQFADINLGDTIRYHTTGTVIGGLSNGGRYFVVNKAFNSIKVSTTAGGAPVDITSTGTGTVTISPMKPINGIGGTSTALTWTSSATTPLRDLRSFLMTSTGVNTTTAINAGEGVAYDFTIDSADQAKQLQISFDYIINSGTFLAADMSTGIPSTLVVYIYDKTNNILIQPSTISLFSNSTINSDSYSGTFQTSYNSTSYRLILHNTATSTYSIKLDKVFVSPSKYVYGTTVTDWRSFTPTGTWTNNTTYTGRFRRVGDSMECYVSVATSGPPNAAGLTVNLPSGYTIDTTKIAAPNLRQALGSVVILDSGLRVYVGSVAYNTATSVFLAQSETGANGITNTDPIAFNIGDGVGIHFTVPIVGWSSTSQVSDGFEGRTIAMHYYLTGGPSISNTGTTVAFAGKNYDTTESYNTSTGLYTVPSAGVYRISVTLHPATSTNAIYAEIWRNGSNIMRILQTGVTSTDGIGMGAGSHEYYFNAGDTISIRGFSLTGGSINLNTDNALSQLSISKINSPQTISATETITARYRSTSGQSIPNGTTTVIDFATRMYDTHGAVTTGASWKYSAPTAGTYLITCRIRYTSATFTFAGNSPGLYVYVNGSLGPNLDLDMIKNTGTQFLTLIGSTQIQLNAGDYFDIRTDHSESTARALQPVTGVNEVTIARIK